jgi:hypothetical protein
MPDPITLAGWLLILSPVLGLVPVAHPRLMPIWSMDREGFIRTVGQHRRAWAWLNAGFTLATVGTTAGLAVMAMALGDDAGRAAALTATTVAYGVGGVLWCVVLAIRTRTTPALADLMAAGTDTEPAEGLVGAATGGIFVAFVALTSLALIALGLVLLAGGGVTAAVASVVALVGLLTLAWLLRAGDVIPAVLYVPTLLLGIALLAGWT